MNKLGKGEKERKKEQKKNTYGIQTTYHHLQASCVAAVPNLMYGL